MPDKKPPPDDEPTVNKPLPLSEDDEEATSIKLDLTPQPGPPEMPAADEEEEKESTKVLDWDRAMRKSIEGGKTPKK